MYCDNCGRKADDNDIYCADCGKQIIRNNSNQGININIKKPKKKNTTRIILTIFFSILALMVVSFVIVFTLVLGWFNKIGKREYITLSDDQVISLYNVIGEDNIYSYNTKYEDGKTVKTISYSYDDVDSSEIDIYRKALVNDGFYTVYDSIGYSYIKESNEDNHVIIVTITLSGSDNCYIFEYTKLYGSLDDYYIEKNTVRVGNDTYGYMSIPEDWVDQSTVGEELEYVSADGNSQLYISIDNNADGYKLLDFYKSLLNYEKEMGYRVTTTNGNIDGYDTYILSTYSYEQNLDFKTWIFMDNKGKVYIISLGTTNNEDIYKYIDTYSTTNANVE